MAAILSRGNELIVWYIPIGKEQSEQRAANRSWQPGVVVE